jgi:threonine/homoserine/homoserine lactone efflux protein
MGWLFAVALGLQEQRRSAVWNALPPIAVGHALSVGLVVALVALIHASIPYRVLRWIAAAVLIGFGVYRLVRARHPRFPILSTNSPPRRWVSTLGNRTPTRRRWTTDAVDFYVDERLIKVGHQSPAYPM